jgi:hypothetical integral membrane protein (TIGR02206 family)
MFSTSHLVILALLCIVAACVFVFRKKINSFKLRKAEIGIAFSLICMELSYHLWMYINGNWRLNHALPLELCSLSLVLTVILLLNEGKTVYELLLFMGLLGASQALFTPFLNFDFPHFRFFHFFYTHMMMIWVPLYFTWIKGYRPTIWSLLKLFVFLNILMPVVMLINRRLHGNYMFLLHKPPSASLLDVLGPYPWYIFSMEGLLILFSVIVWLIFRERGSFVKKRVTKKGMDG